MQLLVTNNCTTYAYTWMISPYGVLETFFSDVFFDVFTTSISVEWMKMGNLERITECFAQDCGWRTKIAKHVKFYKHLAYHHVPESLRNVKQNFRTEHEHSFVCKHSYADLGSIVCTIYRLFFVNLNTQSLIWLAIDSNPLVFLTFYLFGEESELSNVFRIKHNLYTEQLDCNSEEENLFRSVQIHFFWLMTRNTIQVSWYFFL